MKHLKKVIIFLIPFMFFACKKDKVDQAKIDKEIILKYITDNNLTVDSTTSGLYYAIIDSGVGASPTTTSNIGVYYKGYFTSGVVFDQNPAGLPVRFSLSSTIAGWKEGIPKIKKGGKIKLLIPSALGYGATNYASIPANSVLIFDIELDNFQ